MLGVYYMNERTVRSITEHTPSTKKKQISAPGLDFVIKIEWVVEHVGKLICMYINSTANSVILQLQIRHPFYNMIFKSNINCIQPHSQPPFPTNEKLAF